MKIGIISINMYSKGLNFACPLHTYAFQQFLKEHGIDSTVIDYKPVYYDDFDLRHPYDHYVEKCKSFESSGRNKTEPEEWERLTGLRDAWKELYEERERRYDKFQTFIINHYIKTDICYDSELLEVMDPGFDCYICCTDVIWKLEPGSGFDRGFFLASKSMENKWKISYAASRGVYFSETDEDEKTFLHYIDDIDAVSVREESLKDYLNENLNREDAVTTVIDPVLLHGKEFYDRIIVKPEEEHYLFLYYVMEKAVDTIGQAVAYAREHGLKIIESTERPLKHGRLGAYEDLDVTYRYDIGIEEWLGYIRYADCVFTNSFHGCCFCILFEKQFFAGSRTGDKVLNLLRRFGLESRSVNMENGSVPQEAIDYSKVLPILERERESSSGFILSAIERMEKSERPEKDYAWWKRRLRYRIFYHSSACDDVLAGTCDRAKGEVKVLPSGALEYWSYEERENDGLSRFRCNEFARKGYLPDGWRFRFRIDKRWCWYLEDGSFVRKEEYDPKVHAPIARFSENGFIPFLPVNGIARGVAEAFWKEGVLQYEIVYHSGVKEGDLTWKYKGGLGEIKRLETGSVEYRMRRLGVNDGSTPLLRNGYRLDGYEFTGWRMRIRNNDRWYWYMEDGTLEPIETYDEKKGKKWMILPDRAKIPYIPANHLGTVVLECCWKAELKTRIIRKWNKIRGRNV